MTESQGKFLKERLKERDLEEGRREDGLTILNKNLPSGYIINSAVFTHTWMPSSIGDLYPSWLTD